MILFLESSKINTHFFVEKQVTTSLLDQHKDNLTYFFDHLDFDHAKKIFIELIKVGGRLVFTGVGKSGFVAEKIAKSLVSIGVDSSYLCPLNALHGDMGNIHSSDVLICLSKSGETSDLLTLVTYLKKRRVRIFSWISQEDSALKKLSDHYVLLPMKRELCPFNLVPTTSSSIQMVFGDLLVATFMEESNFQVDVFARNHPSGAIGKLTHTTVKDLMLTGSSLPICLPDAKLSDAMKTLSEKKCGCILIIEKDLELKGVFSDGDLRRGIAKEGDALLKTSMIDLMQSSFTTVSKETLCYEALLLMERDPSKKIYFLPVLEDKKLVGLICMHDLVALEIKK